MEPVATSKLLGYSICISKGILYFIMGLPTLDLYLPPLSWALGVSPLLSETLK